MSKAKDHAPHRGADGGGTELWRRITSDIKPIRRRDGNFPSPPAPAVSKEARPRPAAPRPAPTSGRTELEGELGHGVAPGLDKRTLFKLRRGQFRIEGEIDLHRYTQEQAHQALDRFLAAAQKAGKRCVLVITGKGMKSGGPIGVLRHAVPHWLNLPPNRTRVLAFCHATPTDGGEGALYVLLRRLR